jgi:hypothetical protein
MMLKHDSRIKIDEWVFKPQRAQRPRKVFLDVEIQMFFFAAFAFLAVQKLAWKV